MKLGVLNRPVFSQVGNLVKVAINVDRCAIDAGILRFIYALAANRLRDYDYVYAELALKMVQVLRPKDPTSFWQLVAINREGGYREVASSLIEWWLSAFPQDEIARKTLIEVYAESGEKAKVEGQLSRLSPAACCCSQIFLALAALNRAEGDLVGSGQWIQLAITKGINVAVLHCLAETLNDEGKRPEAIEVMERAIRSDPNYIPGYNFLARLGYYKTPDHKHLRYLARLAESAPNALTECTVHFVLGTALDKLRCWDKAFAHFKAGNEIRRRRLQFKAKPLIKHVASLKAVFPHDVVNRPQNGSAVGDCLIFVLGMPRSGTTLVEQILASHPKVRAGGERGKIIDLAVQLSIESRKNYPNCLQSISQKRLGEFRDRHLGWVSMLAGPGVRFVDKCCFNAFHVGLIALLFPDAKIVWVRRHPMDTCLSNYFQDFQSVPFSSDLATLGEVCVQFGSLMVHWQKVLGERMLILQYEDLVNHPEVYIEKLLAYCDLPSDPRCFQPHLTNRPVLTASSAQVKNPINKASVEKWRAYESYLSPLKKALKAGGLDIR